MRVILQKRKYYQQKLPTSTAKRFLLANNNSHLLPKKTFSLPKIFASLLKKERRFDHSYLPEPLTYYQNELVNLKVRGKWAKAHCCFHDDSHPSLSVNLECGSFKCFACGERGSDILAFQMRRYNQAFPEAIRALGICQEGHK